MAKQYQDMIENTRADLEEQLVELGDKLKLLPLAGSKRGRDSFERRQCIEGERDSTRQCIAACRQVLAYIEGQQAKLIENITVPAGGQQVRRLPLGDTPSRKVTNMMLQDCREQLIGTNLELVTHLVALEASVSAPPPNRSNREKMQYELETIRKCLQICSSAASEVERTRGYVKVEDVEVEDDGQNNIVTTIEDLISASHVKVGRRAWNCTGQLSDESLQKLSGDRAQIAANSWAAPRSNSSSTHPNRYRDDHTPNR